ncbi:DUF5675 family protein [Dyadobacter sp. 22481]|uniref:DUF5675 family protein n=1 Tax=Dyadobacter sp. 22481 TaxID=3453926 RepID=UPI003F84C8D7
MEILLTRQQQGKESTLGILSVDGIFNCFVLEDTDRGLGAKMPLSTIRGLKVMGKTAIPTGRYRVEITYSPRFKKKLPILIGVPGFSGIRIHAGNWAKDTDGCLLPGRSWKKQVGNYMVTESRNAALDLQTDIGAAILLGEEVWITVQADYQ